jgi:hypothetical protein
MIRAGMGRYCVENRDVTNTLFSARFFRIEAGFQPQDAIHACKLELETRCDFGRQ